MQYAQIDASSAILYNYYYQDSDSGILIFIMKNREKETLCVPMQ